MLSIPFHIAYLLTRHERVTVPDLGTFIVSPIHTEKEKTWGILSPPVNSLSFNSEIKRNDSLLANSIAKEDSCSNKEANSLIAQYVSSVSHSLNGGENVYIPGVGTLSLNDNTLLFQPDRTLSCNAISYGLTGFSLPYLKDLPSQTILSVENNNQTVVLRPNKWKYLFYFGSVAVAIAVFLFIPTIIKHVHFPTFYKTDTSLVQSPIENPVSNSESENQSLPTEVEDSTLTQAPIADPPYHKKAISSTPSNNLRYYLVVDILPDSTSAVNTLAKFHSKGFVNATILSSDGRYLIYTNYFEDQDEAERFLLQFRKNNPEQAGAWLLKRRDKFDPLA